MQADATRRPIGLWVAGARPRTLPASLVPVAVGTAVAVDRDLGWDGGIIWWRVAAALLVSLALQVGVNYANDYSDGVRGTDDARRVGPQRLVGSGAVPAGQVKWAALSAFGVAGVAGAALAAAAGWWLIGVGIAAVLAAWFYTGGSRPYGYAGLGELSVFVFFGLVATVGSAYVQLEELTGLAVLTAVPVGLLATALLVANNLRDIPGDKAAGKRTLAVRLGDRGTRALYVALVEAAFVATAIIASTERPWVVVALFAAAPALVPVTRVVRGATGPQLVAVLVATAATQLLFGALLATGLWLSG